MIFFIEQSLNWKQNHHNSNVFFTDAQNITSFKRNYFDFDSTICKQIILFYQKLILFIGH